MDRLSFQMWVRTAVVLFLSGSVVQAAEAQTTLSSNPEGVICTCETVGHQPTTDPNIHTFESVGQTFIAPNDIYLTSISFWAIADREYETAFRLFLFEVAMDEGALTLVSGPLFDSAPLTAPSSESSTEIFVTTGFLPLTPGNMYMFLISTAGLSDVPDEGYAGLDRSDLEFKSKEDLGLVRFLSTASLGEDVDWAEFLTESGGKKEARSGAELRYVMHFEPTAPVAVSEPGTLLLLATGLFGVCAVARRRRRDWEPEGLDP